MKSILHLAWSNCLPPTMLSFAWMGVLLTNGCATTGPDIHLEHRGDEIRINSSGTNIAIYHLRPPAAEKLAFESGDYFHPFSTPQGTVVTDLAPSDHPHHRGVFMGFVEMHGTRDADFWGWGQYAPVKGRRIVNRSFAPTAKGFHVVNDWMAEDTL